LIEFDGGGLGCALLDGDEIRQAMTEVLSGQYEIGNSRGDRAARHGGILSLLRVLHQNDAAGFLHRTHADSAV
jgi:hypothetical protein